MVPSLFLSEEPKTNGISVLTHFDIELESSSGQQDADIILEDQDLVLPEARNMTLSCQKEALKTHLPEMSNPFGFLGH